MLVVAVLPAEYGVDPTGLGRALGFTRLREAPAPIVDTDEGAADELPLYEMRATWRLETLRLAERTGTHARGEVEQRVVIPVAVANVTTLTATLTWNDTDVTAANGSLTPADLFEVTLRGPGDLRSAPFQARGEPGREANVSASVTLRSPPYPEENATTGLRFDLAEDRSAIGNWTVVIRGFTDGSFTGGTSGDPGEDWTLTLVAEAYGLVVEKEAAFEGDRARITLAPGQGLEYKFLMQTGAELRYAWTATGPVSWDLHAEEEGKPLDEFESFATGTSDGEQGTHVAPFAGRHGWHWSNGGAAPVTITLVTTGEYAILGVP